MRIPPFAFRMDSFYGILYWCEHRTANADCLEQQNLHKAIISLTSFDFRSPLLGSIGQWTGPWTFAPSSTLSMRWKLARWWKISILRRYNPPVAELVICEPPFERRTPLKRTINFYSPGNQWIVPRLRVIFCSWDLRHHIDSLLQRLILL